MVTKAGVYGGSYRKAGQTVPDELLRADDTVAKPERPLEDMTKEELVAEAKRRGITVSSSDAKDKILAALKAG